jgi:hypothetical protein
MPIRTLVGPFVVQVPVVVLARFTPQNSSLTGEPFALVAVLAIGLVVVLMAARPGSTGWSLHDLDGQCP